MVSVPPAGGSEMEERAAQSTKRRGKETEADEVVERRKRLDDTF